MSVNWEGRCNFIQLSLEDMREFPGVSQDCDLSNYFMETLHAADEYAGQHGWAIFQIIPGIEAPFVFRRKSQ